MFANQFRKSAIETILPKRKKSQNSFCSLGLSAAGGGSELGKAMAMRFSDGDHGAFMERFELLPPESQQQQQLPLHGLTFAIKDM